MRQNEVMNNDAPPHSALRPTERTHIALGQTLGCTAERSS